MRTCGRAVTQESSKRPNRCNFIDDKGRDAEDAFPGLFMTARCTGRGNDLSAIKVEWDNQKTKNNGSGRGGGNLESDP